MPQGDRERGRGRARLLDLFCGAGGCSEGYARAGFEVVGVDLASQPNYPFEFYQDDALGWLYDDINQLTRGKRYLGRFDAIHASPPCPVHSSMNGWSGESTELDLIPDTRRLLQATGLPYVIENVVGAPLDSPVQLCGATFGLGVGDRELRRHRLFETNFPMMASPCSHKGQAVTVVRGAIGREWFDPQRDQRGVTLEEAKEALGVPWMETATEVCNAIPPAYTEHIGGYLLSHIEQKVAA